MQYRLCTDSRDAWSGDHDRLRHKYGFLSSHELDGIGCASGTYPLDFVGDPELGWSGIGQSTDTVCPYAMLRYVCAIANGGTLIEPHMVSGEEPVTTALIEPATAKQLTQMMNYNVVDHYDGDVNFPGLKLWRQDRHRRAWRRRLALVVRRLPRG